MLKHAFFELKRYSLSTDCHDNHMSGKRMELQVNFQFSLPYLQDSLSHRHGYSQAPHELQSPSAGSHA